MATIVHIQEIAEGTIEIGIDGFDPVFTPGQFVELFLPSMPHGGDPRGKSREFSIASAPGNNPVTLITRMSKSTYKKHLAGLTPGTKVDVRGPFGRFVLPERNLPDRFVFVASGVGIAPFLSILRDARKQGALLRPTTLLFKTKARERAPYLAELESLSFSDFNLITTPGENLPATLASLARDKLFKNTHFYMAGGPKPIRDAYEALRTKGIPSLDIFTEEFTGY